jgi:hypothetical protein
LVDCNVCNVALKDNLLALMLNRHIVGGVAVFSSYLRAKVGVGEAQCENSFDLIAVITIRIRALCLCTVAAVDGDAPIHPRLQQSTNRISDL